LNPPGDWFKQEGEVVIRLECCRGLSTVSAPWTQKTLAALDDIEREGRTPMAKPIYIQISKPRQWVMHQQHIGGR
jgi:hypothetical protein